MRPRLAYGDRRLATPHSSDGMSGDTDPATIFLSYAHEDRLRVEPLATALAEEGFDIWWDRELRTGDHFQRKIEQQLAVAACVVVVWSNHSVRSDFVRAEATEA